MSNLPCVGYSANTSNAVVYSLLAGGFQYVLNTDWARGMLVSFYEPASTLTAEERALVKNPFKIEAKTPGGISPCQKLTATGKLMKFVLFSALMFCVAMVMNHYDPASNRNCRKYTMSRDFVKSLGFSFIGAALYLAINWPMKSVWLRLFGYLNPQSINVGEAGQAAVCRKTTPFGWLILGIIMFLSLLVGYNLINLIKLY